jgi:hypothetical protein
MVERQVLRFFEAISILNSASQLDNSVVDPSTNVCVHLNSSILMMTLVQRGLHDIETQFMFKSNPRFVFHDSRGFEAGAIDEFNMVQGFIAKRERQSAQRYRLHVIW